MKVLFIVPYPKEGASTRYRVEQFIPYLKKEGIKCNLRPFVSKDFYKILYKKNNYLKKTFYFLVCVLKRILDIFRAFRYDIIFIHLEAFPFGPPVIELFWALLGKKIIFDLDDAIYLRSPGTTSLIFRLLRCPSKIPQIIKLSRHVIVCNSYLASYARQFINESKIDVIHTAIDAERFSPRNDKIISHTLVIGWIGSHTTSVYLERLKGVLQVLAGKYKFLLRIIGAGEDVTIPGVNVENLKWSLEKDIADFQSLDIGIYPLSESEWIKGKTGFKTIQYMSVGIPCVVSSLGSNKEIIQDGINGFLAYSDQEWMDKLSLLIENPDLRKKIGKAARKTAEEKYSLRVSAPRFLKVLRRVYDGR